MAQAVTQENQLSTADGRRFSHEDCGLCCALSMALDAGLPQDETVASMERWYTAHGDSPVDGTGLEVNAAWLRQEGLDAVTFAGGMDVVDQSLAQGRRVGLAIFSNHAGSPYSGPDCVGHFVEVVEAVDGSYVVMQPVGGGLVRYTRQQLSDNSQNCGFVSRHDYRTTAPTSSTAVAGTTNGGILMLDVNQLAAAVVKQAYITAALVRAAQGKGFNAQSLQQDIIDPAGFNAWVFAIVNGKEDAHSVYNDIVRIITEAP